MGADRAGLGVWRLKRAEDGTEAAILTTNLYAQSFIRVNSCDSWFGSLAGVGSLAC